MNDQPEYIQLESGETITTLKDRLSFIRGKRVLLIWPEEGTALQRKLDLVLLQREARRRAIRIALVTHDPVVIRHAEELNISTFETIGESERKRWKRGRTKVFATRWRKPETEVEPDELMEVASRVRAPSRIPFSRWAIVRVTALFLVVIAVLAVMVVVVPSATVELSLAQQEIIVTVNIIADPNATTVDVETGVIPATVVRIELEGSGAISTTGEAQAEQVGATGSVVFINQTDEAVEIPAGTVVSTSAGTPIRFQTVEDVTVPAGIGEQVEVGVEARGTFTGDIGNVEAGMINTVVGPLENAVTVRNVSATFGGETRILPAVSEDDYRRLRSAVLQQLQTQAFLEMEARATSDTQFIVPETLRVDEASQRSDWVQYSAQIGEITDTLSLSMRVVVEALMIDEAFAQQVARARMDIPRGRVIIDYPSYTRGPVIYDPQTQQITFDITGSATVAGQVNVAMLQQRLAGLSLEDALNYLVNTVDLAEGTLPQVVITPSWFGQMPLLPVRIQIVTDDGT
ncbi:MAG: hypothetical protein D6712_11080 [Chloroflexi bacterium]|nr:MAG: hypothetical protein D6712_11080 [Chloroflexota bacterium]